MSGRRRMKAKHKAAEAAEQKKVKAPVQTKKKPQAAKKKTMVGKSNKASK